MVQSIEELTAARNRRDLCLDRLCIEAMLPLQELVDVMGY
jgi:hypothetical protein